MPSGVALALPPLTTAPLVIGALFGVGMLGAGLPFGALLRPVVAAAGFLLAGLPVLALSIDFSDGLHIAFTADGLSTAAEATLRSLGYSVSRDTAGNAFHYLVSWFGGCDRFAPCDSTPARFATSVRVVRRHPTARIDSRAASRHRSSGVL